MYRFQVRKVSLFQMRKRLIFKFEKCGLNVVVFRFEFCKLDQNHLNMSLKEMIFQRTSNKRISSAFREFS